MLENDTRRAWATFYRSARHNEVLDERTTALLHLAVAMTGGCEP